MLQFSLVMLIRKTNIDKNFLLTSSVMNLPCTQTVHDLIKLFQPRDYIERKMSHPSSFLVKYPVFLVKIVTNHVIRLKDIREQGTGTT